MGGITAEPKGNAKKNLGPQPTETIRTMFEEALIAEDKDTAQSVLACYPTLQSRGCDMDDDDEEEEVTYSPETVKRLAARISDSDKAMRKAAEYEVWHTEQAEIFRAKCKEKAMELHRAQAELEQVQWARGNDGEDEEEGDDWVYSLDEFASFVAGRTDPSDQVIGHAQLVKRKELFMLFTTHAAEKRTTGGEKEAREGAGKPKGKSETRSHTTTHGQNWRHAEYTE